jgi:hypothetical protein
MIRPATYVFAFNSDLSFKATWECIMSWWKGVDNRHSPYFPLLPRLINAGEVVGLVKDGRISFEASGGGTDHVMAIFRTNLRFRWFALHLMDTVNKRLGLRNFAEDFDYGLFEYYSVDEYVTAIRDAETILLWVDDKTT